MLEKREACAAAACLINYLEVNNCVFFFAFSFFFFYYFYYFALCACVAEQIIIIIGACFGAKLLCDSLLVSWIVIFHTFFAIVDQWRKKHSFLRFFLTCLLFVTADKGRNEFQQVEADRCGSESVHEVGFCCRART